MVHNRRDGCSRLAERERESLHAGIEELDLEQPIDDGFRLPDKLIKALLGNRAVALVVYIDATSAVWWCPSMSTRNRTEVPGAAGPMTRCRSRA
jgi:hypothetical protein